MSTEASNDKRWLLGANQWIWEAKETIVQWIVVIVPFTTVTIRLKLHVFEID